MVEGLGLRVEGRGFRVEGLGLRVEGYGFGVVGVGLRVSGCGSWGWGGGGSGSWSPRRCAYCRPWVWGSEFYHTERVYTVIFKVDSHNNTG